MNPQPTRQKSNLGLLEELSAAVNGQAAEATFASGNSVPVVEPAAMANWSYSEPIRTCSFITLCYDAGTSAAAKSRISFPLPPNLEVSHFMLDDLVNACQRATFRLEGKDVLDENFRKATMLGASAFLTKRIASQIHRRGESLSPLAHILYNEFKDYYLDTTTWMFTKKMMSCYCLTREIEHTSIV